LLTAADQIPKPLVIAHRGASGYRPEHTLESYRLGIEQGADAIEPDLVITRDGVLVARHEHEIGGTTDAADKFPARRTTKIIDGRPVTGWFTEDFTLREIKTLRARERLAGRSQAWNGRFEVATLDEVLDLVASRRRRDGGPVIVYPEIKHPSYFRSIGLPLEERLIDALERRGHTGAHAPVFIQSFEPPSLERLRGLTEVSLVQLLDEGADVSPPALRAIRRYADGIGPNKRLVLPVGNDGRVGRPTTLVADAHAAGLFVHVWTLRSDAPYLSPSYAGNPAAEVRDFLRLGVDGFFTDFPNVGR
jgi:glycerophosphoryl diester phosphodiesterase